MWPELLYNDFEVISKSITSALLAPLIVGIIYISYQFNAKKEVNSVIYSLVSDKIPHKSLFTDSLLQRLFKLA